MHKEEQKRAEVTAGEVVVPNMVFYAVGGDSLQLEDGQAVQLEDGTTAYIHTPKGEKCHPIILSFVMENCII